MRFSPPPEVLTALHLPVEMVNEVDVLKKWAEMLVNGETATPMSHDAVEILADFELKPVDDSPIGDIPPVAAMLASRTPFVGDKPWRAN